MTGFRLRLHPLYLHNKFIIRISVVKLAVYPTVTLSLTLLSLVMSSGVNRTKPPLYSEAGFIDFVLNLPPSQNPYLVVVDLVKGTLRVSRTFWAGRS